MFLAVLTVSCLTDCQVSYCTGMLSNAVHYCSPVLFASKHADHQQLTCGWVALRRVLLLFLPVGQQCWRNGGRRCSCCCFRLSSGSRRIIQLPRSQVPHTAHGLAG